MVVIAICFQVLAGLAAAVVLARGAPALIGLLAAALSFLAGWASLFVVSRHMARRGRSFSAAAASA